MDPALAWAIGGLVLVIVEMLSGTFYLLVLAVGAFGAAVAAWHSARPGTPIPRAVYGRAPAAARRPCATTC